jgi:hypothetical protein
MIVPLIVSFLMGAATVAAIIYTLGQRQMDEIGSSFATVSPSCPWCKKELRMEIMTDLLDGARRVCLRCDCGAEIVVIGWKDGEDA